VDLPLKLQVIRVDLGDLPSREASSQVLEARAAAMFDAFENVVRRFPASSGALCCHA
jgi:hypothetical protein